MSTHCVSMIKNFDLSLKIKEEGEAINIVSILHDNVDSTSSKGEEVHHEQLIKDQPIKTFDIWGSILSSSKNKDSSSDPYVHPLVKRSTSSLSEKSLEICTESLGSETGSGCFPSSPTSEHEDSYDDKDNHHHQQQQDSVVSEFSEDFRVYNYSKRLTSSCRSFPPSLPSIHMQSHRQNGRLIVEAASVSPKNSLCAQRLDGHLLLTFTNRNDDSELEMENHDDEVAVFEQVLDHIQEVEGNETNRSDGGDSDEEDSEEEKEEDVVVMEHIPSFSSDVTNVNKATLKKKNQLTWSKYIVSFSMKPSYFYPTSNKFNYSINVLMTEDEKKASKFRECYTYPASSISQSLTPLRDMAEVIMASQSTTATSLNAYDQYFWRKKPRVTNIVNNSTINKYYYNNKQVGHVAITTNGIDTKAKSTTKIATCTQDLVLIRENKTSTMNNNLVPLLRSCKEPRKSLIIWEPYCIATS